MRGAFKRTPLRMATTIFRHFATLRLDPLTIP